MKKRFKLSALLILCSLFMLISCNEEPKVSNVVTENSSLELQLINKAYCELEEFRVDVDNKALCDSLNDTDLANVTTYAENASLLYKQMLNSGSADETKLNSAVSNLDLILACLESTSSEHVIITAIKTDTNSALSEIEVIEDEDEDESSSTVYTETFADDSFTDRGWTNVAITGSKTWTQGSYNDEGYVSISSYNSGEENVAWLVSPSISLTKDSTLSVGIKNGYYKHAGLTISISTDFSGDVSAATWTDTSMAQGDTNTSGYSDVYTSEFGLSAYTGQSIFVAFKYSGDGNNNLTTTFQLSDFIVKTGSPSSSGTTLAQARAADAGTEVTVTGTITTSGSSIYIQDDTAGALLYTQTNDTTFELGNEITITGTTNEFYDLFQIKDYTVDSVNTSADAITPEEVTASGIGESVECELVIIKNITVNSVDDFKNYTCTDENNNSFIISSSAEYVTVGETYASVTGVVTYNYSAYKIVPRSTDDVVTKSDDSSAAITISAARAEATGTEVTTEGIVTSTGSKIFIQDDSAGICIYSQSEDDTTTYEIGDNIKVTGTTDEYKGLNQIKNFTVEVLSNGNTLPSTQTITIDQIGEDYEGEIVTIKNVTIGTINTGGSTEISDGTNTINMYKIPTLTGINEGDTIDVTAIVSVFTNYQLHVVSADDIVISSTESLFFSEYIEKGNYKAFEIYNNSSSNVDLSGYSVIKYVNGDLAKPYTINLSGTLAANDVYVVAYTSDESKTFNNVDLTSGTANYNGDDPLVLLKGSETIDIIGVLGVQNKFAEDVVLKRKSSISTGNTTYTESEWDSQDIKSDHTNAFDNLGTHTVD